MNTIASSQPVNTTNVVPPTQPTKTPRLYMKWEKVDGKLTCKWLQMPD
jgi:hypothetical protein